MSVRRSRVGIEGQNYPMPDMIVSPQILVSRMSHDITLQLGEVIACGPCLRVGSNPDGATVYVIIETLSSLRNVLPPNAG